MTRSRGSGKGSGGEPGKSKNDDSDKRKSLLSEDDRFVWGYTVRSLAPLRQGKLRVHPGVEADDDALAVFAPRTQSSLKMSTGAAMPAGADAPAAQRRGKTPELQAFDPKRARKLRAGRIEVEARLDLHGLTQAEAHAALRRFLVACHRDGRRTVLVITGKGGAPEGTRGGERHWSHGHERGVLKRNVPHWLAEPELRRIVVSFATASVRHGGEGALYVHLRSAAKTIDR